MKQWNRYGIWVATTLVAIYVGAGGGAKLGRVPRLHQSFAILGLPGWFGYFIGTCEVLGAIALFIRPLSALAATGLALIMTGALYYHVRYTPISQAIPALAHILLCSYIFFRRRTDILAFK
jgi:putative oxidoreductase